MSLKGYVFNVARTSLHDGPGVRTVVYMKGCNMRCAWCHNPEGFVPEPQVLLYSQKCIGCGRCMLACPEHHLLVNGEHVHLQEGCVGCGRCVDVCPATALRMCGQDYRPPELMEVLEKDVHYYQKSGGGVSFSGGECLLQAEFVAEMLKRCREKGIHTLIETALNVPWKNVEMVLQDTDMFYVDLKLMDCEKHRRYTGRGNTTILENLERLAVGHGNVVVRIPLIPGVNDDMENLLASCRYASGLSGVRGVMLLRYNPMAEGKYLQVKREYTSFGTETQTMKTMQALCVELNQKLEQPGFVGCRE